MAPCSVPPFHLKRFAVTAFLIIATVRGFLLNFGVYSATRAALGLPFQWSPSILCAAPFPPVAVACPQLEPLGPRVPQPL